MQDRLVLVDSAAGVATVTLNDPDAMNALSPELVGELAETLRALAKPGAETRCLVLTGAGRAFCAGANLKRRPSAEERARMTGTFLQLVYHPVIRMIRDFPAPVVTSVNGAAVGAGMSLAVLGDLIVAARQAYFLQSFRNIGLVPDCGSSWLLPRLVGAARARELALLGERLSAEKALDWGLVNRVVDAAELSAATAEVAARIANGPLAAQTAIRRLHWASPHNSFEQQLDFEDSLQAEAALGPEALEGVAAFREKRPPDFRKSGGAGGR